MPQHVPGASVARVVYPPNWPSLNATVSVLGPQPAHFRRALLGLLGGAVSRSSPFGLTSRVSGEVLFQITELFFSKKVKY